MQGTSPMSGDAGRAVVLAAIADSPAAVAVARWAGNLALASDRDVVVCTIVPVEYGAAATVARVRPVLEELGVRYQVQVERCLVRRRGWSEARQIASALVRVARAVDADVIVVGHRPERASHHSSVAARLLRSSSTDVLVVPAASATTGTAPRLPKSRRAS